MLEKNIIKTIHDKIEDWIASIKDDNVKDSVRANTIVMGGCFASLLKNEKPNDFDCYFRDKKTALLVAEYYIKIHNAKYNSHIEVIDCDNNLENVSTLSKGKIKIKVKSRGIVDLKEAKITEKYVPAFISSNAITLTDDIQIIIRFYGEPSYLQDTFDYGHTKAYMDIGKRVLEIPKSVYELVLNNTLEYTGSKYPICSAFRMRKFIKRGWSINAGQILKMALQISELDLTDIEVLEDQLIGVDSAYFEALIALIREQKEKDGNFKPTPNYIISIVDQVF
jgi:hypothetical protein